MKETEVIRCEECKYWRWNKLLLQFRGRNMVSLCGRIKGMHITHDYDYCSFAERRDDDK